MELTNESKQGSKVKWLTLGEIATDIYRGSFFPKTSITESGEPCIRYAQLYEKDKLYFDQCTSFTNKSKIWRPKYCQYGDILIAYTSNTEKNIAKTCAYLGKEPALIDNICVVVKHNQNPKYLSYALSTTDAQKQKIKLSMSSGLFNISFDSIKKIKIPVPDLKEQEKIVDLLDRFSELSKELEKELEKELNLRKKQYEYYRDELLSFKQDNKVRWLTLRDVCIFEKGFGGFKASTYKEEGIPILRITNIENFEINENKLVYIDINDYSQPLNKYLLKKNDLIIAKDASIGKLGKINIDKGFFFNSHILKINPILTKVDRDYLYHFLISKAKEIENLKLGVILPALDVNKFLKIKIPVPPLEKQEEIANLLDKFWSLSNNIKEGLPAEIFLRKRQYEYYRDELLKFRDSIS